MPENVITSPLYAPQRKSKKGEKEIDEFKPVMVEVSNVSMIFNIANQQLNSLKEYAIALAKRELIFKEFRALDNVSFTVKRGDVFGILGTNGSGKSTMLKIIAGVLDPTRGTCAIHGKIAPLIELGAGFDMELTARENVYLNGALLGYSRKFIDKHFDEIVDFAEVSNFLDMPMKNYSSGMVARIAFAIATVIVPEILIVDEVLSVGDFMFQQKCERRISKLIKDYGVTVLIVSHDNDQIERLCNKAIWIEKGHVRMAGKASDVCNSYRVLGGHIGSEESEKRVFELLHEKVYVPESVCNAVSGESRFSTAVKLAQRCKYKEGGTVILAPGELHSHCLATAGLSGILDAPVLLTRADDLPSETASEMFHLDPTRVIIIGSTEHVHASVEQTLGSVFPEAQVNRIDGATPNEVAINIYNYVMENPQKRKSITQAAPTWAKTAIITYDGCTGDLISFSPYMYQKHVPVFFVPEIGRVDAKTEEVLTSGMFDYLLVLGGDAHIPDAFLAKCERQNIRCERVCGNGPYHANELINSTITTKRAGFDTVDISCLIVTSVGNPHDALAAAAYAGKTNSAFLLEDTQNLDSVSHAIDYIKKQDGAVKHLTFLGDKMRFSKLDKRILGKAVVMSLSGKDKLQIEKETEKEKAKKKRLAGT